MKNLILQADNTCMKKGLFIALEGIDGSGKSTQSKLLAEFLESKGHQVHLTCEPTTGPVGKMIRSVFSGSMPADQHTIAALFVADRLEHLLNPYDGIIKLINEGITVITDRYYFSSYAYHSAHVDMDWVIEINKKCAALLRPDLNIFIDISPEESMERINNNRNSTEMYETLDNLTKVRTMYLKAFEIMRNEEKIAVIAGRKNIEDTQASIRNLVQPFVNFE
jgi:dTMP kinase